MLARSGQFVTRGAAAVGIVLGVVLSVPAAGIQTVWAHRPYVVQMAVTNRTGTARKVVKVMTSCACLKAKAVEGDGGGRGATALPGVMPFELTLDPTGMEGLITKTASVTFDDGTVETMTVRVNVRTRVKLTPGDAAFGVVRTQGAAAVAGRPPYQIVARLTGDAVTNDGVRIVSLVPPDNPRFVVRVTDDGLGVVVGSAPRADRVSSGSFVETWHVTTTDVEVPRIPFVVSAHFVNGLSVTPSVLTVDGGGRGVTALPVSRVVTIRRYDRKNFKVISAETMPRKWGKATIVSRPLNGWQIRIEGIDPDEVRQFSKKPFLEVKTDMPGMERFEIPLRVKNDGGEK